MATSSIASKLWMAATGLFLCLFLVVHLFGNLQLFLPQPQGQLQFNFYSHLLSSNPLIKIAGLVTYASILAHAILSLVITETVVVVKWAWPTVTQAPPPVIVHVWLCLLAFYIILLFYGGYTTWRRAAKTHRE